MIYLTEDDLTANAYEQYITESGGGGLDVLDTLEARAVALATSYLTARFDVAAIFPLAGGGFRSEVLVDVLCKIVLYNLFRRNAARRLPANLKEDYDWAMKQLEGIGNGRIKIGLPVPVIPETGLPAPGLSIWGNISNQDFYI